MSQVKENIHPRQTKIKEVLNQDGSTTTTYKCPIIAGMPTNGGRNSSGWFHIGYYFFYFTDCPIRGTIAQSEGRHIYYKNPKQIKM